MICILFWWFTIELQCSLVLFCYSVIKLIFHKRCKRMNPDGKSQSLSYFLENKLKVNYFVSNFQKVLLTRKEIIIFSDYVMPLFSDFLPCKMKITYSTVLGSLTLASTMEPEWSALFQWKQHTTPASLCFKDAEATASKMPMPMQGRSCSSMFI